MAPATMVWLRVENLSKLFGDTTVLSGLSLRAEQGAVVSISGPNGSGKTTLLRIVAGLLRPSSGEVAMGEGEGAPWDGVSRRRQVSFVSPDLALYASLSARENLDFFACVRGVDADSDRLLEHVGLDSGNTDPIDTFSSGMRQRLKLAYALQARPAILLLDEPGATLDETGRGLVRNIVADQREHGLALLASNDPEEVAYGDETLHLGG